MRRGDVSESRERIAVLEDIRGDVLACGGVVFLNPSVIVETDYMGYMEPRKVFRVRGFDAAQNECLSFSLGEGFSTDDLSLDELKRVRDAMKPY